ncbi:efflux RND transporter permease subunit [Burkholderia sp. AW49-1]
MRSQPIVMTSMAYLLGVVPLALATRSKDRRGIGTSMIGGVLAVTMIGLVFATVSFRVAASVG